MKNGVNRKIKKIARPFLGGKGYLNLRSGRHRALCTRIDQGFSAEYRSPNNDWIEFFVLNIAQVKPGQKGRKIIHRIEGLEL